MKYFRPVPAAPNSNRKFPETFRDWYHELLNASVSHILIERMLTTKQKEC